LPGIVALGIITSLEDIKTGKIRNRYITLALVYSMIVYILFILVGYAFSMSRNETQVIRFDYLIELVTSIFLSLVLGFVMWRLKIWTEGDAKLFLAYTAIVPLTVYTFGYIKYFPSIVILLNTILPLFFFYVIKILSSSLSIQKWRDVGAVFEKKSFVTALILLFSVSWIPVLIMNFFHLKIPILIQALGIMALVIILQIYFKKYLLALAIIISSLRLILDKSVYNLNFVLYFCLFAVGILLLMILIMSLSKDLIYKKIRATDLKEGMVVLKAGKIIDNNNKNEDLIDYIFRNSHESDCLELDKNNFKEIKSHIKEKGSGEAQLSIKDTIPFAPWLFFGVLSTLYVKGNVIIFMMHPVSYLALNYAYVLSLTLAISAIAVFLYLLKRFIIERFFTQTNKQLVI
jgi:hypothetical protein